MGLAIFIWILFLAWLMWSSKSQKETFIFYTWSSALVMIFVQVLYYLFK